MSLYKKCSEVQCEWHMGHNHKNYTYLNGTCYHGSHEDSMYCPKNLNGNTVKLRETCGKCKYLPKCSNDPNFDESKQVCKNYIELVE